MTAELLKIIAVDHIRHEYNDSTPVASEPVLMLLVEVKTDSASYVVSIDDCGDVFACIKGQI